MRLQWANTAREELFRASDFLDAERMGSSVKMLEAVLSAASLLVQHPQLGPAIMGSRIRKWPVADHPFLLLYEKIGRAHVWTPVTNAHLVCRLLLEKKQKTRKTQQII